MQNCGSRKIARTDAANREHKEISLMARKFKRIRSVTTSVLKLSPGQPRFLFIASPMFRGREIASQNMKAPIMVHATDLETGEEGVVILSTAMHRELSESYGAAGYVGKCFELCITRAADKAAGIKYNHVSIAEVAPGDDFTPPPIVAVDALPLSELTDKAPSETTSAPGSKRK
jgi:hypothetical protein